MTAKTTWQKAAAGWCVLMVILLAGIQLANPGPGMPPALWLIFSGVWIFGAAMLWWFPPSAPSARRSTGSSLVSNVFTMHGATASTWAVAIGSFAGTIFAVIVLAERIRARA